MQYRHLGRSGLIVSRLCVGSASFGALASGAWRTDADAARGIVRTALESGITFFDTGPTYGSGEAEGLLGAALREYAERDAYVIASKVFFSAGKTHTDRGLSRRHILSSVEASLRRLGIEHLDLLLVHRWDPATPLEETLRTLDDLVRMGKVRYLGASSMSAWRFMKALQFQHMLGLEPFICMQNYYNLIYREEEREMVPLCLEEGVGITPWSPLARGLLAAEDADPLRLTSDVLVSARYDEARDAPVIRRLHQVAAARGEPTAKIALSWLLDAPGVVAPVLGFSAAAQIHLACAALELKLMPSERTSLEELYEPHRVTGFEAEIARG